MYFFLEVRYFTSTSAVMGHEPSPLSVCLPIYLSIYLSRRLDTRYSPNLHYHERTNALHYCCCYCLL